MNEQILKELEKQLTVESVGIVKDVFIEVEKLRKSDVEKTGIIDELRKTVQGLEKLKLNSSELDRRAKELSEKEEKHREEVRDFRVKVAEEKVINLEERNKEVKDIVTLVFKNTTIREGIVKSSQANTATGFSNTNESETRIFEKQ